ncbi:MAG: hypothetical protein ACO25B_08935 [Chitinophagaceae bacterium]
MPDEASRQLMDERMSVYDYLRTVPIDSNIKNRIYTFLGSETDSITEAVMAIRGMRPKDRARALNTVTYFLKELSDNLTLQKFEIYDIPSSIDTYKAVLWAIIRGEPYLEYLRPIGRRRSALMAATFWQYPDYDYLNDMTTFKRMKRTPGSILPFLSAKPGFRFADSLLVVAGAEDPVKLIQYVARNPSSEVTNLLRNHENKYVRKLTEFANHKNASDLAPFAVPLAEGQLTNEQVLETRRESSRYFQLMVNTLQRYRGSQADTEYNFLKPLRLAIKDMSLAFYVNEINEQHSQPNNVRFASLKELRMEDMYYIVTSCRDELYTSSYLGIYKQIMTGLGKAPADSLFRVVGYDNFRPFMQMAANYNTLADFMTNLPEENTRRLLQRLISGIEDDTDTGLEYAMDAADAFTGFDAVPRVGELIRSELVANLGKSLASNNAYGIKLYGILLQVFDLITKRIPGDEIWATLGNQDVLHVPTLKNSKGQIDEIVLFYGDEDGRASFGNFIGQFKDRAKWEISENENWVQINSVSGTPIHVYANRPLDEESGFDIRAQDSLFSYMKIQGIEPLFLVHRGHSYHLGKTLPRIKPSMKLTVLGSCGGYNNIMSVANISHAAQIIVTKKTGNKFVNDPILHEIHERLLNNRDLVWEEIWDSLRKRFVNNEFLLNLFNEYIPPGRNISLFVYKLFNYYP